MGGRVASVDHHQITQISPFPSLFASNTTTQAMSAPPSPTLSDSELLEGLEEKFDLGKERERRLAALKEQSDKAKRLQETEYGRVVTYGDEKKLIERMS